MKKERPKPEFALDVKALAPTRAFLDACAAGRIEFEADDLEKLGRYLALLLEANRAVNLTAISDPDEAWQKHIFDSLTLLPLLADLRNGAMIADVGSGGGVPGIPLAIAMPQLDLTLIEATQKKAAILETFIDVLPLGNVRVVSDRAETVGQDHQRYRERFDLVIARAVGPVAVVAELCAPLARVGGRVCLIKGQRAEDELREAGSAVRTLGLSEAGLLPTPTGQIVVLEKVSRTPRTYPRRPGEPKRSPLR